RQHGVKPSKLFFTLSPRGVEALPLGVLEALAGAGLPVLLALLLPIVARQEAGALQRRAPLGIREDQGAGDPVPHRFGLRRVAATSYWSRSSISSSDCRMTIRFVSRTK